MYGIDSVGLDGTVKKFEKPIFQTWGMFFAMVFALPIHWIYTWYVHREQTKAKRWGSKPTRVPFKTYLLLLIPSAFDLLATFVANVGLMYVTVSVFQLMKCTVIIFVAILKAFVLKDRVSPYMWVGIGFNTVAALLVGATSFGDANEQINNNDSPGFGIFMIILSCLIQSCQYVYEEKLMDDSAQPLVVVGMEGFWGLLLTTFVVYPIAYLVPGNDMGSNERFDDAWTMLMNSPSAQAVAFIYVIVILGYNVFAVLTTYLLNSIWHAILDNFRPISVWGMDLLLFYVFTHGHFGEAWTGWSWLQLVGMLILLVGTAIYNGSIRISGFYYPDAEDAGSIMRTPLGMSSSMITHSPLITRNAVRMNEEYRRTPNPEDRQQHVPLFYQANRIHYFQSLRKCCHIMNSNNITVSRRDIL